MEMRGSFQNEINGILWFVDILYVSKMAAAHCTAVCTTAMYRSIAGCTAIWHDYLFKSIFL